MNPERARRELRQQELEVFKENYLAGLDDFSAILESLDNEPIAPDPMSIGIDERTFEELPSDELGIIGGALREYYGVKPLDPDSIVREYETAVEGDAKIPGPIQVTVLKTDHEGIVIHEMRFQDQVVRYMVGRDQDI